MEKESVHIGQRLKELAYEKNKSAVEIAAKIGITRAGVYDTYNRKSLSTRTLERYCEVIGVHVNEILRNDDQKQETVEQKAYSQDKHLHEVKKLEGEVEYFKNLAGQLAQLNLVLIEKLGKSEASEMLAGAYA